MLKQILIAVALAVSMGLLVYSSASMFSQDVNSFDGCVAETNLVYTSYPAKCVASDGRIFTNPIAVFDERVINELKP